MYLPVVSNDPSVVYYSIPLVLGWIGSLIGGLKTVGSWIGKNPKAASTIGSVLGGAAKGSADSRLKQDATNAQIYAAAMNGAANRAQIDVLQKKFETEAAGKRAADVARASLMGNVGDFSMGGPGEGEGSARMGGWKSTGGLRPSAFGPEAKEAAGLLMAKHLERMKNGEGWEKIKYPDVPQLSQEGWLEKIMGAGGIAGGILGGLSEAGVMGGNGGNGGEFVGPPTPAPSTAWDMAQNPPTFNPSINIFGQGQQRPSWLLPGFSGKYPGEE